MCWLCFLGSKYIPNINIPQKKHTKWKTKREECTWKNNRVQNNKISDNILMLIQKLCFMFLKNKINYFILFFCWERKFFEETKILTGLFSEFCVWKFKKKKKRKKWKLHLILKNFYLIFVHLIKIYTGKVLWKRNTAKGLNFPTFQINFLPKFPLYLLFQKSQNKGFYGTMADLQNLQNRAVYVCPEATHN